MPFYIIAAGEKQGKNQVEPDAVGRKISSLPSFQQRGNAPRNILEKLEINVSQFKVGSLDSLMALNESSAKLDATLDKTCKKFEKICFDTGTTDLRYRDGVDEEGKIMTYREYIENFKWDARKYNTKTSLKELCDTIAKKMQDNEKLVKTHSDEVNSIKTKLGAFARKDTGNYTQRDFFDEIYQSTNVGKDHFVQGMLPGFESAQFTNLLMVIPKQKHQIFMTELPSLMNDYYAAQDDQEAKRRVDNARMRFNELREGGPEPYQKWLEVNELMHFETVKLVAEYNKQTEAEIKKMKELAKAGEMNAQQAKTKEDGYKAEREMKLKQQEKEWDDEFKQAAEKCMVKQLEDEFQKKLKHRMPGTIVPGSSSYIGLEDKDQNQVHRFVVYRPQAEDAIKALRKKGIQAKLFDYDRQKWTEENAQRQEFQEDLELKTKNLNEIAVSCFQISFVSLMHLKIIRAYVDGVLRFGIPPKFFMGTLFPKPNGERAVLQEMTNALAEESMREMYGEKMDASEQDDFWPFVCISLTSPHFLHNKDN